jgi:hypothetical protein
MRVSRSRNHAKGAMPFSIAVSISDATMAHLSPPPPEPANNGNGPDSAPYWIVVQVNTAISQKPR